MHHGKTGVTIPIDAILYVEAVEGYSKIFMTSGECVMSRILLKNVLALLPPESFIRVHRSFVVSKLKIKSFNRQEILLIDGTALPVGRLYAAGLMDGMTG